MSEVIQTDQPAEPDYQRAAAAEYRIYGPPGCGKTTYLGRQVNRAVQKGRKPLVVSLTRAAALEVGDRDLPLGPDEVGTLHAYCWRQLNRPPLAEGDARLKEWNELHPEFKISPGRSRTVDHDNLDFPSSQEKGDPALAWYQYRRSRCEPVESDNPYYNRFAQLWEQWKKDQELLDFNDLIDRALADYPHAPSRPDAVFVDEAQDLDYQQIALLRRWGAAAGRLIVIGDPDQNLYRWRGSDPECFNNPPLPPSQIRVLAQSYRVPQAVHRLAYAWINRCPGRYPAAYHPRPAAGELRQLPSGSRIYGGPYEGQDSWSAEGANQLIADMQPYLEKQKSIMVLAPGSYMLDPLLEQLKLQALPFHNPRRDNNGRWNPIQRIPGRTTAVDRLEAWLSLSENGYWTAEQVGRWAKILRERDQETKEFCLPAAGRHKKDLLALSDAAEGILATETLEAFLAPEALEAGLSGDLEWYQNHILPSERPSVYDYPMEIIRARGLDALLAMPQITVGTIHSVKGTEADVVYLFPDLSPAGRREWASDPAAQAAVYRLFYVAMTRARESLIICRPRPADRHWRE